MDTLILTNAVLISIHALLAESDTSEVSERVPLAISIHALLAESDRYGRPIDVQLVFLSTLSLRRATICFDSNELNSSYFYPRSPCGERHRYGRPIDVQLVFLSTLSLRRATRFFDR